MSLLYNITAVHRRGSRGWALGRAPTPGTEFHPFKIHRSIAFKHYLVHHWAPSPGRNPVSAPGTKATATESLPPRLFLLSDIAASIRTLIKVGQFEKLQLNINIVACFLSKILIPTVHKLVHVYHHFLEIICIDMNNNAYIHHLALKESKTAYHLYKRFPFILTDHADPTCSFSPCGAPYLAGHLH